MTKRERGEHGTIHLQEKEKQDAMDTKEKKNAKQRKMKCMQGYLDRSRGVENLLRRSQPRWIEKLLRIHRGDRNFLDQST